MFEHFPFNFCKVYKLVFLSWTSSGANPRRSPWFQQCNRYITDLPIQTGPGPAIPISTSEQPRYCPLLRKTEASWINWATARVGVCHCSGSDSWAGNTGSTASPHFALCGANQAVGPDCFINFSCLNEGSERGLKGGSSLSVISEAWKLPGFLFLIRWSCFTLMWDGFSSDEIKKCVVSFIHTCACTLKWSLLGSDP